MALRAGVLRRFFPSSSIFCSESASIASAASSSTTIDSANAVSKNPPSTTLFVSGLNKRTTSEKLHEAFSKFGKVVHARVVVDRVAGFSKGYGFVKYATLEDAAKGVQGMDAQILEGWVIYAEYSRRKIVPGQSAPSETYPPRHS